MLKIYLERANMKNDMGSEFLRYRYLKRSVRLADLNKSLVQHLLCVRVRAGLRSSIHSGQAEREQRTQVKSNSLQHLYLLLYTQ